MGATKVLIHGYASGVFRPRQIARKRKEDGAFRVLGANNDPDHRTVNRFGQQRLDRIEAEASRPGSGPAQAPGLDSPQPPQPHYWPFQPAPLTPLSCPMGFCGTGS